MARILSHTFGFLDASFFASDMKKGVALQAQPSESAASSNDVAVAQQDAVFKTAARTVRVSKQRQPASGKRSRQNCKERGSTEFKGVTRHSNTGRYEAHLWDADFIRPITAGVKPKRARGRQLYLGAYATPQLAARAYDKAAIRKWGEGTVINFEVEDYDNDRAVMTSMTFPEYITHLKRGSAGFSRGKSMYRGVTKHHNQGPRGGRRRENNGKWEARIGRVDGGKYKYLGTFETEQEAADAYDRAVIAYRGSQAVTNFPQSQYKNNLTEMDDQDSQLSKTSFPVRPSSSKPADNFQGFSKLSLAPSSRSPGLSRRSSCSSQSLLELGQVNNSPLQGCRRSELMEIEASDPAWDLDFDDWLDGIEIPTPRMAFNQTVEYLAGIHVEKDFDEDEDLLLPTMAPAAWFNHLDHPIPHATLSSASPGLTAMVTADY